ncbi:MAG TPA: tRNA (adenosine(37)-N6)-dimethylallyltransferase MiaA [Candidatus Babeliales bacterium]|nr:tRNA (adenosine(37)-N6)-dimethylallyltransferase MiaA [Candidatus Babeliales bacterium]
MVYKNQIIFIYGPTGVGKSALAEQLASSIPAEIVNMDLGQFYTPLTIGTAKPAWKQSPIPHHLFDILQAPRNFSVVEYRDLLLQTMREIWAREKYPIVVGGSAFYLKSLLFPPEAPTIVGHDLSFVLEENPWQQLYSIDPIRAEAIGKHDLYRIKRALDIWYKTGKKPSEYNQVYNPPAPFLLLYVTRDRQELYGRINERVKDMIEQGWLEEVKTLLATDWEPFLYEKKLIGYNELLEYLAGKSPVGFEQCLEIIAQRTRHYAKRQNTFWNMLHNQLQQEFSKTDSESNSQVLNLTLLDLDLYIKRLTNQITDCNFSK